MLLPNTTTTGSGFGFGFNIRFPWSSELLTSFIRARTTLLGHYPSLFTNFTLSTSQQKTHFFFLVWKREEWRERFWYCALLWPSWGCCRLQLASVQKRQGLRFVFCSVFIPCFPRKPTNESINLFALFIVECLSGLVLVLATVEVRFNELWVSAKSEIFLCLTVYDARSFLIHLIEELHQAPTFSFRWFRCSSRRFCFTFPFS